MDTLSEPPLPLLKLRDIPDLYLVGGFLREAWRGLKAHDIDLVVGGDFAQRRSEIEAALGAPAFELNQRFASWRIALPGLLLIDISPLHENKLAADLYRRDYTVNTLAVPLSALGPELRSADIEGHPLAFEDLDAGTLRMVERENLVLDPARILRGYRLAVTAGLQPEAETRAAWAALSSSVVSAAPERLHEELLRWLGSGHDLGQSVAWCAEDGVLWALFPPLREAVRCEQNEYHHLDVWDHTLLALSELDRLRREPPPLLAQWTERFTEAWNAPVTGQASAGALTRLALILHDIGKPVTRELDEEGRITFYGHQQAGAELAAPLLDWLRCATAESDAVELLILEHLRLGFYSDHDPVPRRLVYRYITRLGEFTPLSVLHCLADCAAHRGVLSAGSFERHELAAAQILTHYYAADVVAAPPVLLDGHAIMELLGLPPGRAVGRLKQALLEATAAGEVADEAQARAYVRELHASGAAETDEVELITPP